MRLLRLLAASAALALIGAGCSSDKDEPPSTSPPPPPPPPPPTSFSVTVRTGQQTSLRNADGVELSIFPGTVPTQASGDPGLLVFSIEAADSIPVTPPPGYVMEGPPWQLGPEGIDFDERCRVSIDIPDPAVACVLGRYDGTAGLWKIVPTMIDDKDGGRAYADVKHLSSWALFRPESGAHGSDGLGVLHLTNTDPARRASLCLNGFTLTHPDQEAIFDVEGVGAIVAELDHVGRVGGLRNEIDLVLPQGGFTYEATRTGTVGPGTTITQPDGWIVLEPISVENAWNPGQSNDEKTVVFTHPSDWADIQTLPMRGPCEGEPDYSFGTGVIQITLTWENRVDLDLHVIEPSGEEIYFGHRRSQTGGELDHDDICIRGAENIFWETTAPNGTYVVNVHLFSRCGDSSPEIPFRLRTLVDGTVQTFYSVAVTGGETISVTTFTRSEGAGPSLAAADQRGS